MANYEELKPENFFKFFKEISAIPHGSGNMKAIADYCEAFAKEKGLYCVKDNANNVIIYKPATVGFEGVDPIILQSHLDMVCQKTPESDFDFEKDALKLYIDGDYLKAEGTTLGGDDGAGVAIMLSILEANDIAHPAIEAVFTVDEETGMNGAKVLDMSLLKGKKMINLDNESKNVTVSCAGGSDFTAHLRFKRQTAFGTRLTLCLKGLKGGHSGVEIDKNRVNADALMGRVLGVLEKCHEFDILSINGGDKPNAIVNLCTAELCLKDDKAFTTAAIQSLDIIKQEICDREPDFNFEITVHESGEFKVINDGAKQKLIYSLLFVPNGVCEMSAEIKGLVQTSLNIGILKTDENEIYLHYALRSNKKSALAFLEEKLEIFFENLNIPIKKFGHYPPWEYNSNSILQKLYCDAIEKVLLEKPQIKAIHAGLECGLFDNQIEGFDCIAIGPTIYDVHTVNERLYIPSVAEIYSIIIEILKNLA